MSFVVVDELCDGFLMCFTHQLGCKRLEGGRTLCLWVRANNDSDEWNKYGGREATVGISAASSECPSSVGMPWVCESRDGSTSYSKSIQSPALGKLDMALPYLLIYAHIVQVLVG